MTQSTLYLRKSGSCGPYVKHVCVCVCISNNEAEDQNLLGNCVVCCVSSSDKICALLQLYTV